MKSNYYFQVNVDIKNLKEKDKLESLAYSCGCNGIEEFSIDEPTVDNILGTRSYSGGDLPLSVIHEVDETIGLGHGLKLYFTDESSANLFTSQLQNVDFLIEKKEVEDWNEVWRQHYSRIDIDSEFSLIPAWEKDNLKLSKNNLFIYPGMGFGTGNHETTYLCLKLYKKYLKQIGNGSCLDFGTGSGILGLAHYLFTKSHNIHLFDIAEEALENCRQNIELNNFSEVNFKLLLPKNRSELFKNYNLVFANILQNVLLAESKYLVNLLRPEGFLILSGLLNGQENEVIDKYTSLNHNLTFSEVIRKGDWCALVMRLRE